MIAHGKTAFLVFLVTSLMQCVQPVASMDADDAPKSVTLDYLQELYKAVSFDHEIHSGMYGCSSCHHHTAGTGTQNEACKKCHLLSRASADVSCSGCHHFKKPFALPTRDHTEDIYHIDKPGLKGALHLQCLGCHRSDGGPTGCQECHDFTPAGRRRFALKN